MDNQEPAEVSHYTSVDVLPEFLKKKMPIYGTHYQFLNDKTEKKYALEKFDDYFKTKYNEYFPEVQKKDYTVYIASFSTAADDLNLWRAYAPQGGFSIQFEEKRIEMGWLAQEEKDQEIKRERPGLFQDLGFRGVNSVRYTDKEIAAYAETIKAKMDALHLSCSSYKSACVTYYRALFSCFVKHPAFKDEREYRVTSVKTNCEKLEIIGGKPRTLLMTLDPNKAIKSITVSPFGDFSQNELFARLLCQRIGLDPSIVKKSSLCGIAR